ncbi:MAG: hypothetical protein JW857_01475 [Bacteroidales bacterium]|nr:hypothetical protein [Bacteroidales bacterium]
MKSISKISFFLVLVVLVFFGCKKESAFISETTARLHFSNDTICFDTVFTTMGSITKKLLVYNTYESAVKISKIALAEGSSSAYQINVDGRSGNMFSDIELQAGDSLYLFVRITIDPNNQNNPMIVRDSILFEINGNKQDVDLYAWGQDAHFIMPKLTIEGLPPLNIIVEEGEALHWTSEKPYVIVGYAVVDSAANLTIDPGTKIHFYNQSGLWIYKGAGIQVNGTLEKPVVFQGTRLDEDYRDLPGQWDRIWINESAVNSSFTYAIIRNGTIGIQAETLKESMGNQLLLNNTQILNMSGWGIFSRYYQIEANNVLIANAGSSLLNLTTGGRYSFKNSTFANYYRFGIRKDPLLFLSDYYIQASADGDIVYTGNLESAYFGDCIFYGALDDEILIDTYTENELNYIFDYCLLKSTKQSSLNTNQSIFNEDPLFIDAYNADFHLDTLSPAIDKGIEMGNVLDLDGKLRDEKPDLGVFEYSITTKKTKR